MKKKKQRIYMLLAVWLLICGVFLGQKNVYAAFEKEDVTVTITTDRDEFQSGDMVEATLTIKNHLAEPIKNVESELVLPEGLSLKKGDLRKTWKELKAGESVEQTTSLQSDTAETTETADAGSLVKESAEKVKASSNIWIWVLLIVSVILVILGIIFYGKKGGKSKGKKLLSLFLCFFILFGSIPWNGLSNVKAKEKDERETIIAEKEVTVDGEKKVIKAVVSFEKESKHTSQATKTDQDKNEENKKKEESNTEQGTVAAANSNQGTKKDTTKDQPKDENKPSKDENKPSKEDPKDTPADEKVTVTFDSQGGTAVEPLQVEKGTAIENMPQSYKSGQAFLGWYEDQACLIPFFEDTTIDRDMTLYAMFQNAEDYRQIENQPDYYEEDCPTDKKVTLLSASPITAANLSQYMTLDVITGDEISEFEVSANGNAYTITPVGGYMEGGLYSMTVADGVTFQGLESYVREYAFRIYKAPVEHVELETGIIYLNKDELLKIDGENTYEYEISEAYFEEKQLAVGKTICIGDGTENITEDSLFLNIANCYLQGDKYHIIGEDSEIEDVYQDIDISFKEDAYNEILKDGIDTQALEEELYNSEGISQLTMVMAAMLAENEEVTEILGGVSLLANTSDPALMDFSEHARLKDDTLVDLSKKLGQYLKISVKIGEAQNDNFAICNPDYWSAITFTISYQGTLKKKLKINATVTIKEYLNVSLQGYKSFELADMNLEFDYATNVYSQTDIGFKVLVSSANAKDDKWIDISDSIDKIMGSDEKNNPDSLIGELREMLGNKGGYIELCRIPMFQVMKPLITIFPLFSVNLSLDYIVKVNFAAGISSQFSVLDATQIGIAGNSETNTFRSYKNKLEGANRYSFDMSACGYIGLRSGLEGSMTLSFFGLKKLGEVGMAMEVGGYFDIYGYARYHLVKPYQYSRMIYHTLAGGYYLEGGIYLEVSAIARSQIFRLEVRQKLIEHTWPLFTMGDKEILLSLDKPPTFYLTTNNSNTNVTRVLAKNLPTVTGTVFSFVTGETTEHTAIPWSKLYLSFSNRKFKMEYPASGGEPYVEFAKNTNAPMSSAESNVEIYYKGQYMQLTQSSDGLRHTATSTKAIWVDTSRMNAEDVGKLFTAKVYSVVDGVKTLLCTRTVPAGERIKYVNPELTNETNIYNGSWNMDPVRTPVSKDQMEFIYTGVKPQGLAIFKYRDGETGKWVGKIQAANIGTAPKIPENAVNEYLHLAYWNMEKGSGIGSINVRPMNWYYFQENREMIVSGYPTDQAICSVTGDSAEEVDQALKEQYPTEYEKTSYVYSAYYVRGNVNVEAHGLNANGAGYLYSLRIPYEAKLGELPSLCGPWWMTFEGFALEENGEVVYKTIEDVPPITAPIQLYAKYSSVEQTVRVEVYDEVTHDYVIYDTYTVKKGDTFPQKILDEARDSVKAQEGVKWTDLGWADQNGKDFVPDKTRISGDTVLRMRFEREVKVTFDPGDGKLIGNSYETVSSRNDYKFTISGLVSKAADVYNTYKPIGWKNNLTGEVYGYKETIALKDPVTLTAIYEATPKEYTVNVYTAYGVLQDGKQFDSYQGGYQGYLEFMEKYNENWKPNTVVVPDRTYTSEGRSVDTSAEGLHTEISYKWSYTLNQYTLTFDADGGNLSGSSSLKSYYGEEIKLSDVVSVSKTDETRDYIFKGWKNNEGNIYAADATITLTRDMQLQAIWENGAYKEYKITYILDGKTILEVPMHYNDALTDPGTPKEAEGLHFNGWEWRSASAQLERMPERMPAEDLIANGTTTRRYVSYELDGERYKSEEFAAIGSKVTLLEKPELTGYDVSNWQAENLEITDGSFIMPDRDVVLKAVSSLKKYQVTVTIDGEPVDGSPFEVNYGSRVELPEAPKKEGMTFYWDVNTEEVSISQENGKYCIDRMPAKNLTIQGVYTQKVHNIYFCVEGEKEPYKIVKDQAVGTSIQVQNFYPEAEGEEENKGKTFAGWVSFDVDLDKEGIFQMPDKDVYFHTCWTGEYQIDKIRITIEFLEKNPEGEYLDTFGIWENIYLEKGELMQLPHFQKEGYTLEWKIEEEPVTESYEFDPEKETFLYKKDLDGEALSVWLTANYI